MLDHLLPLIYREFEYFDEANKENLGYVVRRRARPVSSTVASTPSRTPPRPLRRSSPSARMEGGVASRNVKRQREAIADEELQAKKQHTETTAKDEASGRPKRRREASDDGSDERGDAKKQHITAVDKEEEPAAKAADEDNQVEQEKETVTVMPVKRPQDEEEQATIGSVETELVTPVKRPHENEEQKQQEQLVTPVTKPQEPRISAKKAKKVKKIKKTKKVRAETTKTSKKDPKKPGKESKAAAPKRIPLQDITHLYVNEHTRSYEYQQRERFVAGLTTSVAIRFF